jgi:hypothetical protein
MLKLAQGLFQHGPQVVQVYLAVPQCAAGVRIIEQGQEQVLQTSVLMLPLESEFQCTANRTFKRWGQWGLHTC